jgi:NADPH-dependent 2,4-dienoyl-CoA reductase/sulfur reductase-like enzyme
MKRRALLSALGSAGLIWPAFTQANTRVHPTGQRVVIIGGGWAGLSAAHTLRQSAPELDVVLINREAEFQSLPLSNPWLVDRTTERLPRLNLASLAQTLGYRFVPADVQAIDRAQRQVITNTGRFPYDWLVLATGVAYDYTPWFGDNHRAAAQARSQFPAGFIASELDLLKHKLSEFRGGDLVMTIPPPPHRCTPAPYERAMLIGWMLKTRQIPGKLTVFDAGAGLSRYTRLFAERYSDQIVYRPHADVLALDPFARTLSTDDGDMRFDHALLLPPLRASDLVVQSGLLGLNAQGRPTRWAGVDPTQLHSSQDERIYLAGDVLDTVSPLFGYYPKTAHIAARLGSAAALQITAQSRGEPPAASPLPESICHVWLDADPPEQLRLEAHYRLRGDGVITQAVRQYDNPQPREEDVQWGRTLYAQSLGAPGA